MFRSLGRATARAQIEHGGAFPAGAVDRHMQRIFKEEEKSARRKT